jgi:hypothetical protein
MDKMAKHPWLMKRGSVYYARAPVPKNIQRSLGKAEIKYSLKTSDRKEANQLIQIEAKRIAELFAAHDKTSDTPAPVPSVGTPLDANTLARICDEHYQNLRRQDFAWRKKVRENAINDPVGFQENRYITHPTTDWYLTFFEELTIDEQLIVCFQHEVKSRLAKIEKALLLGDGSYGAEAAQQSIVSYKLSISPAEMLELQRLLSVKETEA